ncbi:hypothetical protein HQ308_16030 [Rhodococcus sp. BP-241]|uniref:hypothetical protein n=1 Tax=unclassified Rhodococcus (in: high G+C Gram-positive bacteria) TaxID=192944 RepID=UPI001C9B64FC|nr:MULTISPECIES: hypothetical protein [unclassified Rhodococcus (in: high G+C Gram-positive bacteria)]MBY6676256.1 hypothetical protein [Rhodococcus sp. BP-332]MBY6708313.1 hypothetical protein [Rhodococcus sp. BP-241]
MTCAVAAVALLGSGVAQAETRTGWIGPTPPVNGTVYLHTSTIDNGGIPTASTRIYTSFGSSVAPGTMGAKARLFREGALCSATDYRFNAFITNAQNAATTRDCGAGFYNSHGFVAVLNPTNGALSETVTFPTDPLQYPPAASARQQNSAPEGESGVNGDGVSYGEALGVQDDADLPELISAIGTDGQAGYIRSSDLTAGAADPAAEPAVRTVPLLTRDGEAIGTFEISS